MSPDPNLLFYLTEFSKPAWHSSSRFFILNNLQTHLKPIFDSLTAVTIAGHKNAEH